MVKKPSKEQLLQAMDDLEEGRPISADMCQALQNFEMLEESNRKLAEQSLPLQETEHRRQIRLQMKALEERMQWLRQLPNLTRDGRRFTIPKEQQEIFEEYMRLSRLLPP